jgi:hypothetical protein
MAGKACVLASRKLAIALDELSKNALIDLVVDRARAELGEDAEDDVVAALIEGWIIPTSHARGDRLVSLSAVMARVEKNDAKYRRTHGLD